MGRSEREEPSVGFGCEGGHGGVTQVASSRECSGGSRHWGHRGHWDQRGFQALGALRSAGIPGTVDAPGLVCRAGIWDVCWEWDELGAPCCVLSGWASPRRAQRWWHWVTSPPKAAPWAGKALPRVPLV